MSNMPDASALQRTATRRISLATVAAIVVAVLMAIAAGWLALRARDLNHEVTELKRDVARLESEQAGVGILVASHDLRPSQAIDPAKDLCEMRVPRSFGDLRLRALSPERKAAYKGERVNRGILAGTPVLLADLAAIGGVHLADPSSRAMSIPTTLDVPLVPGDRVQLFVTRPVLNARSTTAGTEADPSISQASSRFETVLVLPQPVKVLAVGSRLTTTALTALEQIGNVARPDAAGTVTIEVTEAQAKTILETTGAAQLPITFVLMPK